ncbi:IMPACT family protein [Uliginosibacterium aquaticum]|uniref:YigZ family protein n=1 Tax=Uliginosibacterium aquaticum TaxID=2731212 RepID=A0ABX2IBT6_9RHOO|nr:YigZ family protein [Uliginosibacterium aquaticum]NSL53929.1 YigZ family protein [Uliginosibacterium aquaticum]
MPFSIAAPVHSELLIKKSRFIACVQPVVDRAAAQKIVAALWAEHPGASHVCWALMAGGQSAAVDDGEPSGTAGRPMLDVLRHQDLEGVLATTVRYYGGIMLGAGGLVRAYTDSVAQALRGAQKTPIIRVRTLRCVAPYALEGLVRRAIEAGGAQLGEVRHGALVEFLIRLPEAQAEGFVAALGESGQGKIGWFKDDASEL